jgi:ATP-dependent protease ClpP protease subunit
MNQLQLAKAAWRSRWAARWRGAPPAAHVVAAPKSLPPPESPIILEIVDEGECDRAKARWREQHRWRDPPPDIRVCINGDIDDGAVDRLIGIIAQDPQAPVLLAITSAGGSPQSACRAYDACRRHPAPITCEVASQCSSAAILVLLGADHRLAQAQARFTLHNCAFEIPRLGRHSAALLRDNAAELDDLDSAMFMIIAVRSRYEHWQLRRDMAAETVLDAQSAWLRGILTQRPPT